VRFPTYIYAIEEQLDVGGFCLSLDRSMAL
jgi:hypothetical protein